MRLIDADKLENELVDSIYDNHAALHILWEQPTICDIKQIRDEIADRPSFMMSTSEEYEKGVNAMLNQALMVIDKYKTEPKDIETQATEFFAEARGCEEREE